MMKRCISALLLLTLCLTLCACAEKEKTLAVSVGELSDKVADAMASEQTAEYDETMLLDELGIQSSMFTEGFYKIGASDASVEEVAFFKAADEDSALQLKQKLETRKAATEATQKDYNADQLRGGNRRHGGNRGPVRLYGDERQPRRGYEGHRRQSEITIPTTAVKG